MPSCHENQHIFGPSATCVFCGMPKPTPVSTASSNPLSPEALRAAREAISGYKTLLVQDGVTASALPDEIKATIFAALDAAGGRHG